MSGLLFSLITIQTTFSNNIVAIEDTITTQSSPIVTINDFTDFLLFENNTYITSNNLSSCIDFHYNGGYSGNVQEQYVLPLDAYGNLGYYDISIKFNYTTYDLGDLINFKLFTGSYYDRYRNFIGKDYANSTNYVSYASIWDAWTGSKGKYTVAAYPNDVRERFETSSGSLDLAGDITEHLVRNETGLYSELYHTISREKIIGHQWSSTIINKPLNYLLMVFDSGQTDSQADLFAYEISAILYNYTAGFPNPATIISGFSFTFSISIVTIAVFILVVNSKKKKKG